MTTSTPSGNERSPRRWAAAAPLAIVALIVLLSLVWRHTGVGLWLQELWPVDRATGHLGRLPRGPLLSVVSSLVIGAERTAPLWCAIWAAWAPRPMLTRLAEALAVLLLFACLQTHRSAEDALGLYSGVFCLYFPLLAAVRGVFGGRLACPAISEPAESGSLWRVSVATLLWLTLLAAVAAASLRATIPQGGIDWTATPQWFWRHLSGHLVLRHDALMLVPALGVVVITLGRRRRVFWALLFVALATTIVPMIVYYLGPFSRTFARSDATAWGWINRALSSRAVFSSGFLIAALVGAAILRRGGYRVVGRGGLAIRERDDAHGAASGDE